VKNKQISNLKLFIMKKLLTIAFLALTVGAFAQPLQSGYNPNPQPQPTPYSHVWPVTVYPESWETPGSLAIITQTGDDNTATIDQNAYQLGFGFPNSAIVTQNGDENLATVEQEGVGNQAVVLQNSDGNTANVEQEGKANFSQVTQTGEGTFATIDQEGKNNIAMINQVGDEPVSFVVAGQVVTDPRPGAEMHATIDQDGTGNHASITESAGAHDAYGYNAVPNYGWFMGHSYLVGTDYYPYIIDNPELANNATVTQDGANNEAIVSITGEGNTVTIDQDSPDHALVGNDAVVTINGEMNLVGIDQDGKANLATVSVGTTGEAELNAATVNQHGNGNTATITQNNNAH
jgi:hypothetical protein